MQPDADQPKAPESEAGIEARCEGRSEIPPHGGTAGKIGVVAGRPQLKPRRRNG